MKIAVLVSGGVDSSVALALLKKAGYDVTAFYLKIWLEDEFQHLGDCAWEEDMEFVEKTCKQLGVPLEVISLQQEYWKIVVAEVIAEVKKGRTPNPDIWCNEKIKFGSFYGKIPKEFEKIATGHYAQVLQTTDMRKQKTGERLRIMNEGVSLSLDENQRDHLKIGKLRITNYEKNYELRMNESSLLFLREESEEENPCFPSGTPDREESSIITNDESQKQGFENQESEIKNKFWLSQSPDPIKDQTYFLSRLTQQQLSRALFPIGNLKKIEVRQWAEKYKLPSRNRPDSQGICFLGKFKFSDFLREHLGEKSGNIFDQKTGKKIGAHNGFWFYTLGQRQGLLLSGGPWFVTGKDSEKNEIFVSQNVPVQSGTSSFRITDCNWIPQVPQSGEYQIKLRHGEKFHTGYLQIEDEMNAKIRLKKPDRGIAEGQSAVIYKDAYCLGGGIITF